MHTIKTLCFMNKSFLKCFILCLFKVFKVFKVFHLSLSDCNRPQNAVLVL
jgi:hypothetical protein